LSSVFGKKKKPDKKKKEKPKEYTVHDKVKKKGIPKWTAKKKKELGD